MKVLHKIFFIITLIVLLLVTFKLTKSLKKAKSDYNSIQQTVYNLYSKQDEIKKHIDVNNDFILQFSENKDFIDQMIREKTGHVKDCEIIYKFEEK